MSQPNPNDIAFLQNRARHYRQLAERQTDENLAKHYRHLAEVFDERANAEDQLRKLTDAR
jgi:hypothetical protein